MKVNIVHLFPELMSLYGEYANLAVLRRRLENLGSEVSITAVSCDDTPDFSDADLIYMGDMVIFGANKRDLHKIQSAMAGYLERELGLQMKDNWQVFLFHYIKKDGMEVGRCLDFMGFKFFRNRITLRKSVMLKIVHKARNIYKYRKLTIHDARCMLSYMGWINATNTYQMYLGYIKPYVNIQKCKRIVSRHDRKENINVSQLEICREYRQTA